MEIKVANYKNALRNCDGWIPVVEHGYEHLYEVHWRGVIRNAATKEVLRGGKSKGGYYTAGLYNNRAGKSFLIHRLVLSAFVANTENKEMVNHKDGNKSNNHLANLEWVTRSENMLHALQIGIMKPRKATPVYQYDLQGNLIREYKSSVEPELYGFRSGNVLHCCRGKRKMHGGFKWSFN